MKSLFNTTLAITAIAGIITTSTSCKSGGEKTDKKDTTLQTVATKPVPGTPIKYDSSKRYIFLTWDDSPQPPGTTNCRKIFHEEGVKSTFFAVGFNQVGPFKKRLIFSKNSRNQIGFDVSFFEFV